MEKNVQFSLGPFDTLIKPINTPPFLPDFRQKKIKHGKLQMNYMKMKEKHVHKHTNQR